MYDPEEKERVTEWGVSPRVLLQRVGTDIFRDRLREVIPEMKVDGSHWIELMKRGLPDGVGVVIDDCRFEDEYDAIKKWGGVVIRVERGDEESDVEHESERGCPCDFVIKNDGTKEELEGAIDGVLGL
jgi:hypothetical protein